MPASFKGVLNLQHSEWLWYALAAMALFSIGNFMLKLAVDNVDFSKLRLEPSAPLLLVAAAGVVVVYTAFSRLGLDQAEFLKYAAVFVVAGVLGVLALVQALKTGKVSVVNAVLAMSIVLVTLLSAVFLGEKISLKEIAAMGLALASIALLAA